MTDRFLGIGINNYPGAPLRGCVPDIRECCDALCGRGWNWQNLRSCTDARATRFAIWRRLEWFVRNCKPGDRLLLWFSGHGAQVPERHNGEVDGLTEVLCPADFDFDERNTWLRDDDFISVLRKVPERVNCTVVLDSCFSGGMVDLEPRKGSEGGRTFVVDTKSRAYPVDRNIDFEIRLESAYEKGLKPKPFLRAEEMPNVAFILGCQEDQTCADAYLSQGYRGALSYYLWEAIRENPKCSIREVAEATKYKLNINGFTQQPMIIGPDEILLKPFMAKL